MPDNDSRADQLLDLLASLVRKHGAAPLVSRPILDGSIALSDAPYQPTIEGVGRILHGALRYAGVDWPFEIVDARDATGVSSDAALVQPRIELVAVERGTLVFQVEAIGDRDATIGAVCFEAARAFVAVAKKPRGEVPLTDEHRELAGVAGVYLGFGLVTLATAVAYRSQLEIVGHKARTQSTHIVVGALSPGELVELLAAQLVVRDVPDKQRRALLRHLPARFADELRAAMGGLDRDELLGQLGVPALESTGPASPPEIPPLAEAVLEELRTADEAHRRPHRDRTVPRLYAREMLAWSITIVLVAMAVFVVLMINLPRWTWTAGVLLAVGLAVGYGRRVEFCGACRTRVLARETTCPSCGAVLGELVPMSKRLEIEAAREDDDDELTRQALATPENAGDDHDAQRARDE